MRVLSVCSGIAADAQAWAPLGWEHVAFSEIEPFPSRVLAHRWPGVPNLGDFTTIGASDVSDVDLLCGGTPCQDFSIAGLRAGLGGARGALTLEFLRLADRVRPRWLVWENVPGVLQADRGRALGAFLGGLAELGYGFAWRVLDAQFFGLAQRRKRLFVVGCARGFGQRAAAVLLEREGLRGDPPPSRAPGARVAGPLEARARSGGHDPGAHGAASGHLIPFDTTQITHPENRSRCEPGSPAPSLPRQGHPPAIAFHQIQDPIDAEELSPALGRKSSGMGVAAHAAVRRLTPRECERLMGFPDDYTAIPGAKDGPRYAALGNSIAVPVLTWIGERIARVDSDFAGDQAGDQPATMASETAAALGFPKRVIGLEPTAFSLGSNQPSAGEPESTAFLGDSERGDARKGDSR
jgi:DNA (cytosine-5)-methyltransferase 1